MSGRYLSSSSQADEVETEAPTAVIYYQVTKTNFSTSIPLRTAYAATAKICLLSFLRLYRGRSEAPLHAPQAGVLSQPASYCCRCRVFYLFLFTPLSNDGEQLNVLRHNGPRDVIACNQDYRV